LSARSPVKVAIDTSRLAAAAAGGSLSAPAGRSPTRKRIGILNRRRTTTRIDPPTFGSSSSRSTGLGFSIDAALSGTIPSYTPRAAVPRPLPVEAESAKHARASWFFDIHEDTEEELATNLMEHGACTLDISSDEESARRELDARGKENVPPPDDVSQTRASLAVPDVAPSSGDAALDDAKAALQKPRALSDSAIELDRAPLGDLAPKEYYAEGCDEGSFFVVEGEAEVEVAEEEQENPSVPEPKHDHQVETSAIDIDIDIDALMQKSSAPAPEAKLLQPLVADEQGQDFEVWESGSAKGDE
jgi:hypothetical protein